MGLGQGVAGEAIVEIILGDGEGRRVTASSHHCSFQGGHLDLGFPFQIAEEADARWWGLATRWGAAGATLRRRRKRKRGRERC